MGDSTVNAKQHRKERRRIDAWCRKQGVPTPDEWFPTQKGILWPYYVAGVSVWPNWKRKHNEPR